LCIWEQNNCHGKFKHQSILTVLYKQISLFASCSIFTDKQMGETTDVRIVKICELFLTCYLVLFQ
jgi:hypothetical protein